LDRRRSFLESRRLGVGGSDLGALCGFDEFGKTALDIWREKVLPLPEVLPAPNPPQARGVALEPIICDQYAEETGYMLVHVPALFDPAKPWLRGNPDRMAPAERGALEAKAPGIFMFAQLLQNGINEQYQLQGNDYCLVAKRAGYSVDWLDFRFLQAERWQAINVRVYPDPVIMRSIEEVVDHFWHEHVLKEIPPPADGYSIDVPVNDSPIVKIDDPELLDALDALREAKAIKKEVKLSHDLALERIKTMLPGLGTYEAEGDEFGRVHRLTYSKSEGRRTPDMDRLRGAGLLDPIKVWAYIDDFLRDLGENNVDPRYLDELREQCRANLDDYMKQGDAFTSVRLSPNAKAR
jgi:predicted phage-related endonuclease